VPGPSTCLPFATQDGWTAMPTIAAAAIAAAAITTAAAAAATTTTTTNVVAQESVRHAAGCRDVVVGKLCLSATAEAATNHRGRWKYRHFVLPQ
jgi:hypothetical protein